MNRFLSILCLLAAVFSSAAGASAATRTVRLTTGTATFVGADGITSAVLASANGDVINVIEPGVYNRVTIAGPKVLTINGLTTGGVQIASAATTATNLLNTAVAITTGTVAGPTNISLNNLTMRITGGNTNAAALFVQAQNASPTTVSLLYCKVLCPQVSNTATLGGVGLRLQTGNAAGGGAMTLIARASTIETLTSTTGAVVGRGALDIAGTAANMTALKVLITGSTIHSAGGNAFNTAAGDNQNITIERSTLLADYVPAKTSCLNQVGTVNNGTFTIRDSSFQCPGQDINVPVAAAQGNTWLLERSTFSARRFTDASGTGGTNALRFAYAAFPTATLPNAVKMYNCVVVGNLNFAPLFFGGTNFRFTAGYCNFASEVLATANGFAMSFNTGALATQASFYNCLFAQFRDPLNGAVVLGRTLGNVIARTPPADETSLGADRTTTTIGAINLADFSTTTSLSYVGRDNAVTSTGLLADIQGKDRRGFLRPNFKTDKGAFELQSVPAGLSSFNAE